MATVEMRRPVELIPAGQQGLWGWPAVLNFALGGLGAGLYVVAVVAAGFGPTPAVIAASWIGPALVLAGFVAVATEAGRPFRGPRVLTRVRTSWMSRELWIGGVFVLLAVAGLALPLPLFRVLGVVAALLLALAQGFIVRRARGITAWGVSLMPTLFLLSALLSGSGLYLLIEVGEGPRARVPVIAVLILLAAGLAAWTRYLRWSSEPAFARAVEPLTRRRASRLIVGGGYIAPFLLVALSVAAPPLAAPALAVAGVLMVGAQFHAKALLILAAGHFRPVTLGGLRIQRFVGESPQGVRSPSSQRRSS